jgi:hypothetical protein
MPDMLDFLGPYLAQMGGGGVMSPGQPVGGGGGFTPNDNSQPGGPSVFGGGGGSGMPTGDPSSAEPTWRSFLPGAIGTAVSGLAGHFLGGNALAGMSGFAQNYANVRHQDIQRKREQEFQTQKAVGDQAHKMWQELQGADLSMLPPNLQHLARQKNDFDQKYAQAIAKDGISPKEAQELISLGSVIRGALPQVESFSKQATAAEPYTSAISSGQMEPPPGAERIAEMGLEGAEASRLAGIEAMRGAELTRQQYDTPVETQYGLMTPRDQLQQRIADARAAAQAAQAAQMEQNRLRVDADRDRAFAAQQQHWNASEDRRDREVREREQRYENMPVAVQTTDEAGNPITRFVTRKDLIATGGAEFNRPIPAGERQKIKDTDVGIEKMENLIRSFKPEYVGPIGTELTSGELSGTLYGLAERLPDFGQVDPLRSDFTAQNAEIKNATIRAITGAQLQGAAEAKRIMAQVPDASRDNPVVWQAKADRTLKNMQILSQVQRGLLDPAQARTMFDFGELQQQGPGGGQPDLKLKTPPTVPGGGTTGAVPPGMKLQRNRRTGETRLVPAN